MLNFILTCFSLFAMNFIHALPHEPIWKTDELEICERCQKIDESLVILQNISTEAKIEVEKIWIQLIGTYLWEHRNDY